MALFVLELREVTWASFGVSGYGRTATRIKRSASVEERGRDRMRGRIWESRKDGKGQIEVGGEDGKEQGDLRGEGMIRDMENDPGEKRGKKNAPYLQNKSKAPRIQDTVHPLRHDTRWVGTLLCC